MSVPGRPTGHSGLARRAAASSEAHVAQAAQETLERGNAVDAVVAGVLAAAAESPAVFLGPVQFLVGGGGGGLLAIDGRVRQPGLGVPRPRGFLADEPIPMAARVGVPMLPGALAAAAASLGTLSLLRLAGPAIAWARQRSPERAAFFEFFARRGAQSLTHDAVASELMVAAGRAARGLLTRDDLSRARPDVVRFDDRRPEASGILTVPWRAPGDHDASVTHLVIAADARGQVAAACYETAIDGVSVPALGIVAPPCAAPVMRGLARVGPGEFRPASAPIAIRARHGFVDLAIGVAATSHAERSLQSALEALDEMPTVVEALATILDGRPVAIVRSSEHTRVLASA